MEVMGFHIVDIVIVSLIAFLAIKGLVNGFSKELLNFISVVAGVLLAARYNLIAVNFINEQKLAPAIPEEFAKIIGFILILLVVWLIIGFISSIISRLTATPSSFVSRLLGYILSAARYIFIFSLIIFWVSQSEFFKKSATKYKTAESQLFEPMSKLGADILDLDVNQTTKTEDNVTATSDANISKIELTKTTSTEQNSSNY